MLKKLSFNFFLKALKIFKDFKNIFEFYKMFLKSLKNFKVFKRRFKKFFAIFEKFEITFSKIFDFSEKFSSHFFPKHSTCSRKFLSKINFDFCFFWQNLFSLFTFLFTIKKYNFFSIKQSL